MKKVIMMLVGMFMLSCSLMAQEDMPRRQKRVTYEQMTEKMVKELQLDEKQQKKVAKLNKKYKTLIEGEQVERPQGQRPPMGEWLWWTWRWNAWKSERRYARRTVTGEVIRL